MRFNKTALKNGVRVITAPMAGNPTVTVMLSVNTGSFYEASAESGLSHFLEHMCFKGTPTRPTPRAITTELDSIGAIYNAYTAQEVTGYWAKADAKHFNRIADIIGDIFKNSTFPEKEIELEKGVVCGEIDMYADDPQEKASRALAAHMYQGQPAERDILGTKETVRAITRETLMAYRKSQYTGPNVIVTIAGGVSEADMMDWVTKNLSDLSSDKPRPESLTIEREQKSPEVLIVDKDTDQAHVVMAWRTFRRDHPDRHIARLVKNILKGGMSSRLFIRLRDEMGSGYYVSANHALHTSFGYFGVATGTTHVRVAEIVKAVIEEAEKLKTEPITKEELDKVKEFMRAHRLMSLETSDDVAGYLAEQEAFDGEIISPEEFEAIFGEMTADDVMRVAKILFDRTKLTIAAIGRGIDREAVIKAVS